MNNTAIDHRSEANVVFELAIASGRLSANIGAVNYAGDYMYMGNNKGLDCFKHINTRQYLADKTKG